MNRRDDVMSWSIEEAEKEVVIVKMNSNKLNLMDDGFFDDLNNAFDAIEKDFSDRPVVLTSAVNVFSAGLDIKRCYDLFQNGDMEEVSLWFENFRDSLLRVFSFSQPLIGAVNGHAIAGGLILALCCDIRIAATGNAKFGLNEIKVGFPLPATLAEIIKHSLGTKTAEELIFRSELVGPQDGHGYGLFHELAESENLTETAVEYAGEYTGLASIDSYSFAKKALRSEVTERIYGPSMELDEEIPDLLVTQGILDSLKKVIDDLKK